MQSLPNRRRIVLPSLLIAAWGALPPETIHGAGYDSWSKVEQSQETRDYGVQIREGKFDAAQKAFVDETLLPQLGLEANRASIAAVRQRIRDVALRGAAKKEVVEQGNAALRDGMLKMVADKDAELLVRVNAVLLIGELQDMDRAPWTGSLAALTKAVGDAALPLAIRVAALNGLSRHVAAAGAGSPAATAAAPVVAALVTSPPEGDTAAVRWLLSRALDLLPRMPAQPQAVAAAATILADGTADVDLRVRAAAAVGGLAKADSGVDAAAAVGQVKSLAIAGLAADLTAAEERRFSKKLAGSSLLGGGVGGERGGLTPPPPAPLEQGGGGGFGGPFGGDLSGSGVPAVVDEDAVPPLACRRNAWRLFTLAEAIKPSRSGAGLAGLLSGEAATAAADVATRLRELAIDLDKQPDEATLTEVLAELEKAAGQPDAAPGPGKPAAKPAPAASPFDQPAGGSPF